jgi:hypothetical protein
MACEEVTTTATSIVGTQRIEYPLVLKNQGPATVFLDDTDAVTADQSSTGGYPLAPGESVTIGAPGVGNDSTTYTMWGITAEGEAYVAFLGF